MNFCLSESKPNVFYQAGFAHALPIPSIHICSALQRIFHLMSETRRTYHHLTLKIAVSGLPTCWHQPQGVPV